MARWQGYILLYTIRTYAIWCIWTVSCHGKNTAWHHRSSQRLFQRNITGTEMLSFHRFHVQCLKNIHKNSVCLLPFLCGVVVFLDRGRPPQSWYILPPLDLNFWLVISILRGQSTFHWSCSSSSSVSIMLCFIGAVVASNLHVPSNLVWPAEHENLRMCVLLHANSLGSKSALWF